MAYRVKGLRQIKKYQNCHLSVVYGPSDVIGDTQERCLGAVVRLVTGLFGCDEIMGLKVLHDLVKCDAFYDFRYF